MSESLTPPPPPPLPPAALPPRLALHPAVRAEIAALVAAELAPVRASLLDLRQLVATVTGAVAADIESLRGAGVQTVEAVTAHMASDAHLMRVLACVIDDHSARLKAIEQAAGGLEGMVHHG